MCLKIESLDGYYIAFTDVKIITDTGNKNHLMDCNLTIVVEDTKVNTSISFLRSMIDDYYSRLVQLYEIMEGSITFFDIDSRMSISLVCDKTGIVFINGYINGKTHNSRFEFDFVIDQSYLPNIIKKCNEILT